MGKAIIIATIVVCVVVIVVALVAVGYRFVMGPTVRRREVETARARARRAEDLIDDIKVDLGATSLRGDLLRDSLLARVERYTYESRRLNG